MTDHSVDALLHQLAERPISDAAPPASVAPAVIARLEGARRRDRTWLGRLLRDLRASLDPAAVGAALRARPFLGLAPLLLGAAVIGAIAAGAQWSRPGPDRPQASASPPPPSPVAVAVASSVPAPSASAEPVDESRAPIAGGGYLVASSKGSLVIVGADGSDPHRITSGKVADYFPAWSPDGTKIAFFSQSCSFGPRCPEKFRGSSLVVIDADGSNRRVLVKGLEDPMMLRWLPDGSGVVMTYYRPQENVTETVGLDGSVGKAVPAPLDPAFISPDGSEFVRVDGRGAIRIAARDGSSARVLVAAPENAVPSGGGNLRPSLIGWTSDGRSVAYVIGERFGTHRRQTWLVGRDGSDPHVWADLPEGGVLDGWSADRAWMLVEVPAADGETDHFVVAKGDGSEPRAIDASLKFLGWTPDRRRLIAPVPMTLDGVGTADGLVVIDPADPGAPVTIDTPNLLGFDWRSTE